MQPLTLVWAAQAIPRACTASAPDLAPLPLSVLLVAWASAPASEPSALFSLVSGDSCLLVFKDPHVNFSLIPESSPSPGTLGHMHTITLGLSYSSILARQHLLPGKRVVAGCHGIPECCQWSRFS